MQITPSRDPHQIRGPPNWRPQAEPAHLEPLDVQGFRSQAGAIISRSKKRFCPLQAKGAACVLVILALSLVMSAITLSCLGDMQRGVIRRDLRGTGLFGRGSAWSLCMCCGQKQVAPEATGSRMSRATPPCWCRCSSGTPPHSLPAASQSFLCPEMSLFLQRLGFGWVRESLFHASPPPLSSQALQTSGDL